MSAAAPDNPPVFPYPETDNCFPSYGIDLRDWLAAKAPVTLDDAARACGWASLDDANLAQDSYRVTLWSVLTLMRYEYADAMLEERSRRK